MNDCAIFYADGLRDHPAKVPYAVSPNKRSEYDRKYRAEHRDELNRKARKYREERCDELNRRAGEYNHKWHAEHPEKMLEYRRKYYAEHSDKVKKSQRKYRAEHPEVQRRASLKHDHGITIEDYDALVAAQGGVCAICGGLPGGKGLLVDHDHATGAIRGLLCRKCNAGLGQFDEDQSILKLAIEHLSERG